MANEAHGGTQPNSAQQQNSEAVARELLFVARKAEDVLELGCACKDNEQHNGQR